MTEPRTVHWPYFRTDINLSCFTVAKGAKGKDCMVCGRPAEWRACEEDTRYLCLFHRLLWSIYFDGWKEAYEEYMGKEYRITHKRWNHMFDHFVAVIKRTY